MHDTAQLTGAAFLKTYGRPDCRILDVGSMDVSGTLRPDAPPDATYIGVDIAPGPAVDIVLEDPHVLPFDSETFDLVVSTSCFEHDEFFWLTFAEMARVVRPGGFLYISAPSYGDVHRHPVDCWRFYPDAATALGRWAERAAGVQLKLIESFLMRPRTDTWIDFVAIYGREPVPLIRETIETLLPPASWTTLGRWTYNRCRSLARRVVRKSRSKLMNWY
jgi:SAM-dependent methyltransferase